MFAELNGFKHNKWLDISIWLINGTQTDTTTLDMGVMAMFPRELVWSVKNCSVKFHNYLVMSMEYFNVLEISYFKLENKENHDLYFKMGRRLFIEDVRYV